MSDFEAVIGLEIHAQISSKTKMFCGCDNDSFGIEANTNVCPICMGFPGMLPVTNIEAIEKGVIASLSLNCEVPNHSKFDRKNYFYPDLPSGFQISQFDEPLAIGGYVEISINDEVKKIGITRLHLENDAGKLTHTNTGTHLDFNRAGTPLMEIVSEPDLRSAEEAKIYAEEIQKILRYSGSSTCDMEKGMMRFDASVSIRKKNENILNPRAEIKNLNSFRSLKTAIEYEISRQIELWENGEPLSGDQTVGWDEEHLITKVLREKESSADYRYFPEPDLPPIDIDKNKLNEWRKSVPELPQKKITRLKESYNISDAEAIFYSEDPDLAQYFEEVARLSKNPGISNSFVLTVLVSRLKEKNINIQSSPISPENLAELVTLIDEGVISNNIAKTVIFDEMWVSGKNPKQIVAEKGITQVSDQSEIEDYCKKAIEMNPKAVEDVKNGQMKAIGALVGFVMKESKGAANPKMVNDILIKLLV